MIALLVPSNMGSATAMTRWLSKRLAMSAVDLGLLADRRLGDLNCNSETCFELDRAFRLAPRPVVLSL